VRELRYEFSDNSIAAAVAAAAAAAACELFPPNFVDRKKERGKKQRVVDDGDVHGNCRSARGREQELPSLPSPPLTRSQSFPMAIQPIRE